jgi:hypothetical protein
MRSIVYWQRVIAVAFVVMVTGYWLMSAFTFTIPTWLVVLGSTLGVLIFVDWLSGRFPGDSLDSWIRPVSLAVLALLGYGLLTKFNFLPSSALLLAVLGSNLLVDLVAQRIQGTGELPLPAAPRRTTTPSPSTDA